MWLQKARLTESFDRDKEQSVRMSCVLLRDRHDLCKGGPVRRLIVITYVYSFYQLSSSLLPFIKKALVSLTAWGASVCFPNPHVSPVVASV